MDAESLYQALKKVQEPKGYFFNPDGELVFDLLRSLILNRERYGYMCCPCRLASGDKAHDGDIICPCVYRTPDVAQYGSCYCALYVSREWIDGTTAHAYVPERRPADRVR